MISMATQNRYNASISGVPLECQTLEDGFSKAISKREIPYVDGAETDDLGLKARTCKIRCYFLGENYSRHLDLITLLQERGVLEFIHPVYGLLKVRIEDLVLRHDDSDSAEVDLNLVEDSRPQAQVSSWHDVQAAAEEQFEASVAEQKESVLAKIKALASAGEASAESAIAGFEGILSDVTNPANTLTAVIDYGTDLPGRFVQAAAQATERYAVAYQALKDAPELFVQKLAASITELRAAAGMFSAQADSALAARLALEAGGVFSTDEAGRGQAGQSEQPGFDYEGRRTSVPNYDALNSRQIEAILSTINTSINQALAGDRGNLALKQLAADLGAAALRLKQTAANVITVRVSHPTPLHLLCLRYNLPYSAAENLLALNPGIKDPNRITGEVLIYV